MFVCVCMSVCVYMCMYNMYVSVNGCIHVSMFCKYVYVFVILYLHACMISTVTEFLYCDLLCYLSCLNNNKTYGIKKCLHLYIYYTWYTLMLIIHTIHIRCSVSI